MADTTGGDIRSVIKNATQGGLARNGGLGMKKAGGVTGQGDTIATKQEIETKKADNSLSPKPTAQATNVGQRVATPNVQRIQAVTQPQNVLQKEMQSNEVVAPASQQTVGTFQNSTVQPIKNIKIEGLGNHDISLRKGVQTPKKEEKKNPLIETEGEKTKRMSDGVYSLYVDAYNKGQQGSNLTIEDVLGNKNYQKQFYGVDQKLLQDMINDANLIAQYDYDDQNALYLMDKYKQLGLSLDFEKLSHPNKGRVLDNMATKEGAGGVWGMVDTFTPFNIAERFGGKTIREDDKKAIEDNIQGFRNYLEDQRVDILSDEEVDKYTANDVAKLDKEYEKYYHNTYETKFADKKVWDSFAKDVKDTMKSKDMDWGEAEKYVLKNGKYNGVAYEKFGHETVDQGRFWDDKDKEKEYNEKVKELKSAIRDEHDNKNAYFGNATVNNAIVELAQIPLFAYDIAKNPGTFAKSLRGMAKGVGHKAIEGYADLFDTWIATTKDAIDVIKGDKEDFSINYKVGDIREKMAKGKGYESFDDMLLKLGQIAQEDDTPGIKFVYNTLNSMNNDMDTAQVMIDYFDDMYGGALEGDWGKVLESIKEHPASFVSDLSGFGELTAGLLGKWGLISPEKVRGLQNLFGAIDPYEVAINKANKLQYGPVLKAEVGLAKTGLKVASKPFRWGKNVLDTIVNKISGISAEERKILKENPELVEGYIKGTENRQTLVDKIKEKFNSMLDEKTRLGQIYEQFKNSTQRILTDGIFERVNELLADKGIYKVNGKLQFPDIGFTEKQQVQILAAYNMLDKIQKGEASIADARGVRRMIDSTLDWEGNTKQGLDLEAINLIKDIRRSIDDALKDQVPGFREADANYAQISNDIKALQKDWFNKDGTIKDNAYSRVGNLTNKANKARLERLEKYMPGITNELKGLAVAESLDKAGKAMVGQYANQIWGVRGGITALAGLFGGGVAVMPMILGMLGATMATPKNLAAVLKWQGKVEKPFKTIISKIENGIKLTAAEVSMLAKFLSENQEKLQEDARYMYENGLISDEEFKAIQEKKKGLKNQFRKIEKDYKAGKISTKEYKEAKANYRKALDDAEYDVALQKAEAKVGDAEREIEGAEKRRTTGKYAEKANNIGFVTKLEQDMTQESKNAGTTVRGYTNLKEKIIALANNPTDRTAQHEFFHAVMRVVDPETRKFLLNEARKILGGKVGNTAAEEWLAESLGIYAKRKDIKAGILDKVKWGEGVLVDKLRNFLQKNYEWMQNYNGDRETINKMFDEILKDDFKIGENGMVDLSYLLKDGGDNGGLKAKNGLKNKPTNGGGTAIKYSGGVKLKKDTGAVKYKADINGKSVQIDTKATSPDQLAKINTEGLSVMKAFISDKQAEKALNVAPELLTKDGDAYLWTHTNKYDAKPFTAFENAKDSKYKEFTDNQIAWFTNSKEMSNSYASEETKLADTKAPRTDAEFKKYLDNLGVKDEGKNYLKEEVYSVKKGEDGYYVERLDKWDNTYDDEGFRDYAAFYGGMTRGAYDVLEKAMGGLDNMMDAFKQRMDRNNYKNVVVERKNGKIHVHTELPSKESEVYKDKQGLYAGMYAERQGFDKYHYQGIIQDMKNPLVVDLGKYAKGEIRFGEKVEGQGRFWSDLGTAYDFIKKNTDADIDTVAKTIKDEFKKAVDNEDKIYDGNLMNAFQNERLPKVMEWKRLEKEGDYVEARKWSDEAGLISSAEHKIANLRYGIVEKLTPEEAKVQIGDKTVREIYNKSKKAYEKYKEIYDLWKEQEQTYRQDYPIGGGLVSDKYTRHTRNNFINYLKNKGIDEGAASMILHDTPLRLDKGWLASYDLAEMLKNKKLQTNDYVFYALRKGGYDGVIFKDIVDYGHLTEERKGGDVVAAFNSKQFKAWDNANPTDSKYISYKRDTGLKAKLPDTDNDGRKLSEAQRKFFAGTKVVDKNGNLLRVYHGTRGGDFTVFRKGNSWSNNLAKVGYWFTPNKEGALKFAEGSWGGDAKPRAEEVYLDIKNPKVYEPSKFNLLKNEERNAKIDEQRKVYNQKADKADGLDYTHAGGFFHDEFDHPYYDRAIFEYLKRSWDNDRKYDGKYGKYNPEEYRALADEWNRNRNANLDYDKILKDFEEYTKAKLDEEKEYSKLLDIKHNDPYDDFMYDIYKIDSNYDNKWTKDDLNRALNDYDSPNKFVDKLKSEGYDGIIIKGTEYDGEIIGGGARNDQYVAFDSNQIKRITNENPTKNDDIRFKKGYHGSPAKFDRFDSTHMGEGEGAQAHGWGHYIAIDKATAEKYAISRNSEYKGMPIEDFFKTKEGKVYSNIEKEAIRKVGEYIPTYTAEEAIEILPDDLYPPKTAYDRAVINAIQNLDPADFNSGRHLYDVDFKDPARKNTPSGWNYLDEETPYSRKTFDKIFEEAKKQGWDESKARNYIDDKLKFNGNDKMYGVWIRQALDMGFGEESGKKTSKFLESLGYDGIHYNGLQDGEAYVLFGDDTGKITNHVAFKKDVKGLGKKQDNDSGLRYKKARHGSQADFDKFDSSHMGEGEGQQVHGWGHYAAVNRDTAKQYYAEMGGINYKGKQVGGYGGFYDEFDQLGLSTDEKNMVREIAIGMSEKGMTAAEAKADLIAKRKKWTKEFEDRLKYDEAKLAELKKSGKTSRVDYEKFIKEDKKHIERSKLLLKVAEKIDLNDFNKRHLYELDIPDPIKKDTPTGSNYLEEEATLTSAQLNKMADAIDKKIGKVRSLGEINMDDVKKAGKYLGEPKLVEWVEQNIKDNPGRTVRDALYDVIRHIPDENGQKKYWMDDIRDLNEKLGVNSYTTDDLRKAGSMNAKTFYHDISRMLGGDKEASKLLESLGYDGIHYFGGRDGEAYVLFSDNAPQITDHIRYKKDAKGLRKKDNSDSGLRYKRARHGSPADFDRFDSSHMGEGEGAQAHGWGHYVAVNEQTGRHYAEMGNRNPKVRFEGKEMYKLRGEIMGEPIRRREPKQQVAFEIMERMELGDEGFDDAVATVKRWTEADIRSFEDDYKETKSKFDKESLDAAKKRLEVINDITRDDFELLEGNRRNLYDLEIPDPVKRDTPTGTNYIEEDGKLTLEQRKDLIKRLREKNKDDNHYQLGVNYLENMLYGAQFKGDDTRKDVYRYFSDGLLERPKEASKALEAIGYDGIHYYGGRDGEAYVLFNDNAPQIQNHIRYKKDVLTQKPSSNMGEFKASNGDMLKLKGEMVKAHGNDVHKITAIDPQNKMDTVISFADVEGNDLYHLQQEYEDGIPSGYYKDYIYEKKNGTPIKEKSYVIYHIESAGKDVNPNEAGLKVKGKGYGTDLLNELKKEAKENGVRYIIADDTTNRNSKSYWEKQGFEPIKGGNHILDLSKDKNGLAKKDVGLKKTESGLQRKENSDIRYKLTNMGFTPTRKLTVSEVDDIKGKKYGILATYDKKTSEDTLKTVKQVVKNDLNKNVKDGFKIRRDDMKHAYNSHGYDTELGYGKSITKKDFENIPDILENYDNIQHFTVLDNDGYLVDRYKLYKDYGKDRQYIVFDVNDLKDGKTQISFKTMYINDTQGRAKYKADEKAGVVKQRKQQAKKQYGDRFHL